MDDFTCDRTMNGEVIRPLLNRDKARREAISFVLEFFKKNGIEYSKGIGGDFYHLKNPLAQSQSADIQTTINHLRYRLEENGKRVQIKEL